MEDQQPPADQPLEEVAHQLERMLAPVERFVEALPALLIGLGVMAAGVLVALLLRWLVRAALLRAFPGDGGFVREAVARTRDLTIFAFVLLGVVITLPALQLPGGWAMRLQQIITILLIVLIGWTVMVTVGHFTDRHLRRYAGLGADDHDVEARKAFTQIRVLRQTINIIVFLITAGAVLLTFESVQQYGAGLFASAGVAGIVAAVAARPVLSNLFAGVQIALTQPIRIHDAVIVEGEWGWIEEVGATFVVVKLWDWRRLVLPVSYFIEKPFQNWTKEGSEIIGSVILYVDYAAPFDAIRAKAQEFIRASRLWDGRVAGMQVIDATESTVQIRALMSARSSPQAWDLRCEVREKLLAWLRDTHPEALPRTRADLRTDLGTDRSAAEEAGTGTERRRQVG